MFASQDSAAEHPLSPSSNQTSHFPKSKRLLRKRDFDRIYQTGTGVTCYPLRMICQPNNKRVHRLGLAVPKRVGGAVTRNRIRRCLREAFRHMHWEASTGYDVMIIVQANLKMTPDDYRCLIAKGMTSVHQRWNKKNKSS